MPVSVLVVDDEAVIRDTLAEFLTGEGFAVATAATGEAAVKLAAGRAFDVCLCDLHLPHMDGLEVLAQLATRSPDTAVVLVTAYGTVETAVEAFQSGAADYLMGLIDADSIAAHAIALQIAAITFMVPMGVGQAATIRVGLSLGRGDRAGIGRAGWTAFVIGVGFMAAMAVVMWLVPRPLMTLFLDDVPANARVIGLGVSFLAVAAIFQIVDGAQVVGAGMLRGLHDTRVPMLFAFFGYWVIGIGIGVWLAFDRGWQGVGIWTGLAAGLAVVAVLMLDRWRRREKIGLVPSC